MKVHTVHMYWKCSVAWKHEIIVVGLSSATSLMGRTSVITFHNTYVKKAFQILHHNSATLLTDILEPSVIGGCLENVGHDGRGNCGCRIARPLQHSEAAVYVG